MSERRILEAIDLVACLERDRVAREIIEQGAAAARISAIGANIRSHDLEQRRILRERVVGRLLLRDLEPLHSRANPFRAFDIAYDEPRWTQWLAFLLRPESGPTGRGLVWSALCESVARAWEQRESKPLPPKARHGDGPSLATAATWRAAKAVRPEVQDEFAVKGLGQIDLLILADGLCAGLENKLWEGWHDGPDEPQADRYRKLVLKQAVEAKASHVGLVLLSCRTDLVPQGEGERQSVDGYPDDYIYVTWREFAQNLRRELRALAVPSTGVPLAWWPATATLVSLEQDLLSLPAAEALARDSLPTLHALSQLNHYLQGAEDEH